MVRFADLMAALQRERLSPKVLAEVEDMLLLLRAERNAVVHGLPTANANARTTDDGMLSQSEKQDEIEATEIWDRIDRELVVEEARVDRLLRLYNL